MTQTQDSTSEGKAEVWTPGLRELLETSARAAGFDAVGVAAVPEAEVHGERFSAWVEQGRAGEMEYLKRRDEQGTLVRQSVRTAIPWVRSVVVCAASYNAGGARSIDPAPAGTGWIARYAWSGKRNEQGDVVATDYHDELLARLKQVEAALMERAQCTTRCYVDTGPIVERALAAEAGVGWIGKNTCVLNQSLGSWMLLGVVLSSLEVGETTAALVAQDRCGTCTRCIDACPTGALLGSREAGSVREMDASRCIAYLTIEKKGAIEEALREGMGRQLFGCDICQEVCPWNRRAPIAVGSSMLPREDLVNPALEWLAGMDSQEFKRRFKGSPLERTGRKRLRRNVAIAMGNSGEERFLPVLDAWRETVAEDSGAPDDPILREAAGWAARQIRGRG